MYKGTQKCHKDRVELAVYESRRRFVLEDLANRIAHDVAKIEEHFYRIGKEVTSLVVTECEHKFFTVEITLIHWPNYYLRYEGTMKDAHWPVQSNWEPYKDPVLESDWCLIRVKSDMFSAGQKYLAQDCTLAELLEEFNEAIESEYEQVRNFASQVGYR